MGKSKNDTPGIAEILNECQKSFATHRKGLLALRKFQTQDPERFVESFVPMLNRILVVFKREPAVERLVSFVISFATAKEEGARNEELAVFLLSYLLERTEVKDKAVRMRACQFIAGIINGLDEECEIDGELWDDILAKMLLRTRDKIPVVRSFAVQALARLQDPNDPDNEVIQEYMRLLAADTSTDVRKVVLSNIGLSKMTLAEILRRTKDVSDVIRKHSFGILATKVNVKVLSISQRIALIKEGLNDRVDKVREACMDMICKGWLQGQGEDVLKLLSCLDVEEFEETVEPALKGIFKQIPMRVKFDADNLTPEMVYCWRVYAAFLHEEGNTDRLEEVVPEIVRFCEIVRKYQEKDEFVLKQLLLLALHLDLADEAGRRSLSALLVEIAAQLTVAERIVQVASQVLRVLHPGDSEFNLLLLEILADVKDPMELLDKPENRQVLAETEETLVKLQQEIADLKDKKEIYARQERYDDAQRVKQEVGVLEEQLDKLRQEQAFRESFEEGSWLRCLTLTECLLERSHQQSSRDAAIGGLLDNVIRPSLRQPSVLVRTSAIKCLGLYCLLSPAESAGQLCEFVRLVESEEELPEVKLIAAKCLFDLTLIFHRQLSERLPSGKMEEPSPEQQQQQQMGVDVVLRKLEALMGSDDAEMRTTAVEGMAKLFVNGACRDPQILSRLLLLFFSPTTEEDTTLRQCLSIFFPAFAFMCPENQQCVETAFMPTMRAVLGASSRPPYRSIKPESLAEFLLHLTDAANLAKRKQADNTESVSSSSHDRLSIVIANEILDEPSTADSRLFCKLLCLLNVSRSDQAAVKSLRVLADGMLDAVKDKTALVSVKKFVSKLESLDQSPHEALGVDELAKIKEQTAEFKAAKQLAADASATAASESDAARPAPKAKGGRKRAPAKKPAARRVKKEEVSSDSEADSDADAAVASDADSDAVPTAASKKPTTDNKKARNKAAQSDGGSSDEETRTKPAERKTKAPARRKAPSRKGRKKAASSGESDSDADASEEEAPVRAVKPRAVAARRTKTQAQARLQQKQSESEDESEESEADREDAGDIKEEQRAAGHREKGASLAVTTTLPIKDELHTIAEASSPQVAVATESSPESAPAQPAAVISAPSAQPTKIDAAASAAKSARNPGVAAKATKAPEPASRPVAKAVTVKVEPTLPVAVAVAAGKPAAAVVKRPAASAGAVASPAAPTSASSTPTASPASAPSSATSSPAAADSAAPAKKSAATAVAKKPNVQPTVAPSHRVSVKPPLDTGIKKASPQQPLQPNGAPAAKEAAAKRNSAGAAIVTQPIKKVTPTAATIKAEAASKPTVASKAASAPRTSLNKENDVNSSQQQSGGVLSATLVKKKREIEQSLLREVDELLDTSVVVDVQQTPPAAAKVGNNERLLAAVDTVKRHEARRVLSEIDDLLDD